MTMGTKEELQKVRGVIEAGWTQGVMARDSRGNATSALSESATCFCMVGAVEMVCGHDYNSIEVMAALKKSIYRAGFRFGIVNFNDQLLRTKEEVLAVVDSAIAEAV